MDEKQFLEKFIELGGVLNQANNSIPILEAFQSFKNGQQAQLAQPSTSAACSPPINNQKMSKAPEKTYKVIKRSKDEVGVGNCVVCNSPGSKFHFGAIACAACCAFFRRSISEKRSYVCRYDRTGERRCVIDYGRRCFCRACRLAKCLEKGMDPHGVQPHRDCLGVKGDAPEQSVSPALQKEEKKAPSVEFTPNDPSVGSVDVAVEQLIQLSKSPYMQSMFGEQPERCQPEPLPFPSQPVAQTAEIHNISPQNHHAFYNGVAGPEVGAHATPSSSFQTREGSPDSICDGENLVERMVQSYEELNERRRMFYCPQNLKDIMRGTPVVEHKNTWKERYDRDQMRFQIVLYVEWFNAIPLFLELDADTKESLIRASLVGLSLAEKYYHTMKTGGLKTLKITSPNGWYTDLSDNGAHFMTEEFDSLFADRNTVFKALYRPMLDALKQISGGMLQSNITDIEMCMLFGMILFNTAAPGLHEEGIRRVANARDCLFREWFRFYYARGVSKEEASILVGNTILIIGSIREAVQLVRENFQMVRFFQIFDYDKIVDDFMS